MGTASSHSVPQPAGREAVHEPPENADWNRVDLVIFGLVGVAAALSWSKIVPAIKGIDVLAIVASLAEATQSFARRWRTCSPAA